MISLIFIQVESIPEPCQKWIFSSRIELPDDQRNKNIPTTALSIIYAEYGGQLVWLAQLSVSRQG